MPAAPGVDTDIGFEPRVPARAASLPVLSSRGAASAGCCGRGRLGMAALEPVGLRQGEGLEEEGSRPAGAPEADAVPKENRPRWRSQDRRAGGGKMLLWGTSAAALPPPQTGGVWAGQGGKSPPQGLLSHGTLPHPHPLGCSAGLGGQDPLSALGLGGSGGPGVLSPLKGLGRGGCCAAACSSMTNGAIRTEA